MTPQTHSMTDAVAIMTGATQADMARLEQELDS
jgi:hypothetical protein